MSKFDYDYFVIGGGSGGVRSARIAAQHGAKVGVAEGKHWGGTCVNLGCVPKKLMAYAADYGAFFEESLGFGWTYENVSFDWSTLIERKDKEINRLNAIYQKLLKQHDVDIYSECASFTDEHTLQVGDKKITAEKILIATGGVPRYLRKIPGCEHTIVSDDIFHLKHWPGKTVLIGGGYISVEFAHILHGLGCEVELLYRGNLFLRGFDDDLRIGLAHEMRRQGIKLHFDCDVTKIDKVEGDDHPLKIHTTHDTVLECNTAFTAIGREPNSQNLGLDKAGVDYDEKGYIKVNKSFKTSKDHIYAVGDVTTTPHLTPVAIIEGHYVADMLFGSEGCENKLGDYDQIPTAVFSSPPIGTVGMSESEACKKGHEVTIFRTTFKPLVHRLSGSDEETMMKLVVDKKTDKVLGLHILGRDAPEMLQGFATALRMGATKADFDKTLAIHPTSAEELVTMSKPVISSDTSEKDKT